MLRPLLERLALISTLSLVLAHYLWTVSTSGLPFGFQGGDHYNRLADALLAGRLSVLPDPDPALLALANPYGPANQPFRVANVNQDLSLYGGRYYVYFGIAPVLLLFLPFRALHLVLSQSLAAAILMFGAACWATAAFIVLQRRFAPTAGLLLRWLCVVGLALCNFGPFVLRRPAVYEVAAASTAFFQAATLFWLAKAFVAPAPRPLFLVLASTSTGLAVASRPTQLMLLGLLLAAFVGLRLWLHSRRTAVALFAPAAVILLGLGAYNQARFDAPWEFGMKYGLTDWDMRHVRQFSVRYLPFNLPRNFLLPPRIDPEFPFFHVGTALPLPRPEGHLLVETNVGLFGCAPFALMALAWPFLGRRPETRSAATLGGALTVTGLALGIALSTFGAVTLRYTLDFTTPILLSSALAWACVDERAGPRLRPAIRALLALLVGYSAAVNVAISLTGLYDRLKLVEPETYDRLEASFLPLQKVALAARPERYGPARLTLRLPTAASGEPEALVAAGAVYRHDILCIRYPGPGQVAFRFEHRGSPPLRSRPVVASPDAPHVLEIEMGSLYPVNARALARLSPGLAAQGASRRLRVHLDGEEVMAGEFDFIPSAPEAVLFGKDAWGNRVCDKPFSGTIAKVERMFPPQ